MKKYIFLWYNNRNSNKRTAGKTAQDTEELERT